MRGGGWGGRKRATLILHEKQQIMFQLFQSESTFVPTTEFLQDFVVFDLTVICESFFAFKDSVSDKT